MPPPRYGTRRNPKTGAMETYQLPDPVDLPKARRDLAEVLHGGGWFDDPLAKPPEPIAYGSPEAWDRGHRSDPPRQMSLDLYSTALVWHRNRGAAKLHGRQVPLEQAPVLPGALITMIDYRPEIGEWRIQRCGEPARDMRHDEVLAADDLLRRLVPGQILPTHHGESVA